MKNDVVESKEFFEYRGYLQFLARRHLSTRYNAKLDQSDIVQQTLLNALATQAQFQGQTEAERLAWLRRILVRNVAHATRELHTKKRDIHREQLIAEDINDSSSRLETFLLGNEASPSQHLVRKDKVRLIAAAIELLPRDQRQVVILRYWEEKSLVELAEQMGKSTSAVAGILHRATKKLRSLLASES